MPFLLPTLALACSLTGLQFTEAQPALVITKHEQLSYALWLDGRVLYRQNHELLEGTVSKTTARKHLDALERLRATKQYGWFGDWSTCIVMRSPERDGMLLGDEPLPRVAPLGWPLADWRRFVRISDRNRS